MDFLAQEFLQDFLDESDGHLRTISEHLLRLEQEDAQPDESTLNALFRAFHTLKGLCGMVGLAEASELAHVMESLLRDIRKGERAFTAEMSGVLLDGVQVLQQLIEPLRTPDAPKPDSTPVLARLKALVGEAEESAEKTSPFTAAPPPLLEAAPSMETSPVESAPLAEAPASPSPQVTLPPEIVPHLQPGDFRLVQQAVEAGRHIRVALFEPDEARAAQGVNVNRVRADLQNLGEILKGVPLIEKGQVRFAFILACDQPPGEEAIPFVSWMRPPVPAPVMERRERKRLSPSLRVEVSRLDEILQLVGELVVARNRLQAIIRRIPWAQGGEELREVEQRLARHMRTLRQAVMRTRMVPLSEVFGRMPLAVRDMARREGKQVRLVLEGEHIEIDKSMVEQLLDPLLHMVRNAVTHGLETPQERMAAGKPPQGTLTIRAESAGERVIIHVQDDGRGVDLEKVAAKAHERGLLETLRPISPEEALRFIAHPGFSTRTQADLGAGRGVGMDVVMEMVTSWNGEMHLTTEAGRGSTFSLYLPLSLTIFDALLVGVGNEQYAIPRDSVVRVLPLEAGRISHLEGREWYPLEDRAIHLARLADLFSVPQANPQGALFGLLLHSPGEPVLLAVEKLVGMREVVMHAIHDPLVATPAIAGATELGDGRVVLVLDSGALIRLAQGGI